MKKSIGKNKYSAKHLILKSLWLILIPIGILLPKVFGLNPQAIEQVYSRKIYPIISKILGAISSSVNFSLAEILLVAAAAVIVILLVFRIIGVIFGKLINKHRNRMKLLSLFISIGILAGILINAFYAFWGLNHFRLPVSYSLNLSVEDYSSTELSAVFECLLYDAEQYRQYVDEDENGVFTADFDDVTDSILKAYETAGNVNPVFSNVSYKPKKLFFSKQFSALGIAGVFIPYTAEPNVNIDQPSLYIPTSAAHELAHYFGFARENEANFIAYYISEFSDDYSYKYSATMNMLICTVNLIYESNPEEYAQLRQRFSDKLNTDLDDYRTYLAKYSDNTWSEINDKVNDTYLKHNGHSEGIDSYEQVVELLVALFKQQGRMA